jgi:ABC-type branched-subunit amino acid transport system substrate-binding protein
LNRRASWWKVIFQSLGTQSNSAIQKYINAKKVPQLFVATGATKWGDPENFPWTMGWQPNYQSEGRIYAKYILKNYPSGKIAALWQNDDAGKDQMKGLRDGLGDKVGMIIADKSYEVADPTVDSQIVALKDSGADIFVTWAAPKGAAQAIRKVGELGWKNFSSEVLLPGITINTGARDFFPIEQMQLMKFEGESWRLFGEVIDGEVGH